MQKILIIYLFSLLLFSLSVNAQPGWQWGKRGGSTSSGSFVQSEGNMEMVTDMHGNLYVLALISKGVIPDIDGYPGISGNDQLSLSSWDCEGNFRWVKFFGSPTALTAAPSALGTDSMGGIYFTGITGSEGYFDTDTVLPATDVRIFYIVKYDTAGAFQWLRMPQADTVTVGLAGTANKSRAIGLDVAPNGDVYLLSHLAPGIFGSTYTTATDGFHLLRYDKYGDLISGMEVNITVPVLSTGPELRNLTDFRTGFARDHHSGRFYVSGLYRADYGALAFGSTSITSTGAVGAIPMFLAAFDSSGNSLWAEQSSPSSGANPMNNRPQIDDSGNIIIGGFGTADGENEFYGHIFTSDFGMGGNMFLLSIDPDNNKNWATNGSTLMSSGVSAIAIGNGKVIASGAYAGQLIWQNDTLSYAGGSIDGTVAVYLAQFNVYTGNLVKDIDSIKSNGLGTIPYDVTAAASGHIYTGGSFQNQLLLPSGTLTNTGGAYDWFATQYGSPDCDCSLAIPDFTYGSVTEGAAVSFTYTGSSDADSIRWEFGDGSTGSGFTTSHIYSAPGTYGVSMIVYNSCGITVHYQEINSSTGINAPESDVSVAIYPNPATESMMIEGAGIGTSVELYNSTGQQVLSTIITQPKQSIDLSGLGSGIYIIHFTSPEGKKGNVKMVKL